MQARCSCAPNLTRQGVGFHDALRLRRRVFGRDEHFVPLVVTSVW
jgi:hypothetical protein